MNLTSKKLGNKVAGVSAAQTGVNYGVPENWNHCFRYFWLFLKISYGWKRSAIINICQAPDRII